MEPRKSRSRAGEDDVDYPRRSRRRVKQKSGTLVWVFAILGVVALAGIGGVVVFLVLRDESKQPEKTGDRSLTMADRFLGKWEGGSPERPSLKVYLEVTRDRVILQAQILPTKEWSKKLVYRWKPVSVSGNTLIISRQEVYGEKQDLQWSIQFASDDEMSVTSLVDRRLIAHFKRIGKMITNRDREDAAARNSAKLIGKWFVPTFQSIKLQRGTLEFAAGGKAIFTLQRDRIGERTDTGTWKVLEAEDNKLKLEISGIEDFELLHLELRSDKEIALSQASKAGFTGVQLTATRVL